MSGPPAAAIDERDRPAGEGWQAQLQLRFEADADRTRLAHRRHHGPLLVQRAFHPEPPAMAAGFAAQPCHVYLLHPPGGVVSGDELQLDVAVQARAHALLTTPAAGKFYRRGGERRVARLTQTLGVDGGVLEWLPQENIFYPETAVELRTIVQLQARGRFIGWEIGCLGLPASQADLGEGTVRQSFELWHDGAPVLLERLTIERACLASRWGLAGHAAMGTWLAFPATPAQLALACAQVTAVNCADMTLACTLVDGALSCRGIAARADRLKQAFIDLWSALRPELLGRAAIRPRIWAT
ncbi:MAG TPA: urease accessory protein UreD [Steroidobacteraceae bacterium]